MELREIKITTDQPPRVESNPDVLTFTPLRIRQLRADYEQALRVGAREFLFYGRRFRTRYVKHLVEYLERHIKQFARDDTGAAAVEYAVICGAMILTFISLVWVTTRLVAFMADAVNAVSGGGEPPPPGGGS